MKILTDLLSQFLLAFSLRDFFLSYNGKCNSDIHCLEIFFVANTYIFSGFQNMRQNVYLAIFQRKTIFVTYGTICFPACGSLPRVYFLQTGPSCSKRRWLNELVKRSTR